MDYLIAQHQKYARDVLSGKIVASKYIKQACERYLSFFDKYEYRADRVQKAINFMQKLKHSTGKWAGTNFVLSPWQIWITSAILGFYKDDGTRLTNTCVIEVSRKNGKSFFSSALACYFMVADGEMGAEVDFIANSAKQAGIAFTMAKNQLESIDPKGKHFKRYRSDIKFLKTKSVIQVLSSDAMNNDGWNAHCFVGDECHAYPSSAIYDVMVSSQGSRQNPMGILISTAGFLIHGFFAHFVQTCKEILSGTKEDDSTFAAIYELDPDDDWKDETVWIKSNPNLNVTVSIDYIRRQIQQAKNNPALEYSVKTKTLCMWTQSQNIWIPHDLLLDSTIDVDLDKIAEEYPDVYGIMGVDLSAVSDLTAISLMLPIEGKFIFKTWYFLPESCLQNNVNSEQYAYWNRMGMLHLTQGNVVDYDVVVNKILQINEKISISAIAYDSWNATQFILNCQEQGLPMQEFPQSLASFNRPTKEFERLIKMGKVMIDNNEITRWCFANCAIKTDFNENCLDINTQVPTPDGMKVINDIKIGDFVFNEKGEPVKVINITDVHIGRDCYELEFMNGAKVIADSTHQWYIEYPTTKYLGNNRKQFMTRWGMKDTEWLFNRFNKIHFVHTIYNGAVQYDEKQFIIDPYTLGQWLGDGTTHGSTFTVSYEDAHMYDYLKDKYTVKYGYCRGNCHSIMVSGGLRSELKSLGLLKNKHIPEEYFYGSVDQRLALVQGLMDTDGSCSSTTGQCAFSQKKRHIVEGLCRLLDSLGIRHGSIVSHKCDGNDYYSVLFYTKEPVFRLERKLKNQEKAKCNLVNNNPLVSIRKVDSVPTKCITVDSDNHLFLITDKYLVTSNCKPVKGGDHSLKIDGTIAMLECLGNYLSTPQYTNEITTLRK